MVRETSSYTGELKFYCQLVELIFFNHIPKKSCYIFQILIVISKSSKSRSRLAKPNNLINVKFEWNNAMTSKYWFYSVYLYCSSRNIAECLWNSSGYNSTDCHMLTLIGNLIKIKRRMKITSLKLCFWITCKPYRD